jgi:hypothetical protein
MKLTSPDCAAKRMGKASALLICGTAPSPSRADCRVAAPRAASLWVIQAGLKFGLANETVSDPVRFAITQRTLAASMRAEMRLRTLWTRPNSGSGVIVGR